MLIKMCFCLPLGLLYDEAVEGVVMLSTTMMPNATMNPLNVTAMFNSTANPINATVAAITTALNSTISS